ncbi:ATP-binding protein [Candidatus Solincola sp.]|nr:HAMP domain-containing sensor histidine kinase [Actinomycetota bacterium]MDI7251135.1 HAMP domain-containing sensor histidine kinase [Actinomycetota bacterium]
MRQQIIQEIARSVVSAGGVENIIRSLVEATARGTGARGCTLFTLRERDGELVPRVSCGIREAYLQKGQVIADHALRQVLKGNPLFVWDATGDPRIVRREELRREGISSIVFLPFRERRGVRGLMRLYFGEPRKFDREDLDFLNSVAELCGAILEMAEERETVARDAEEARRTLVRMRDERRHFLSFLSMVTHDLKSPLVAVQGYLKMLLRKASDRLDERMLQGIRRSIQRIDGMMELISDLLELSRLESGQVLAELKEVSWEEVLSAAVEMAHELADPRGIHVVSEIQHPLPEVFASDIRLQQLILNLVSNSVRFTPRGGRITIRARRENDQVVVSVEDEGKGIEPEKLPHIFEEFFKGDPESPEGTGLGLSICKRIVEMHHGEIWAESPVPETGRGTRVTFTIPVGVTCDLEDRWKMGEAGEGAPFKGSAGARGS